MFVEGLALYLAKMGLAKSAPLFLLMQCHKMPKAP
jgi:hypothetical protein